MTKKVLTYLTILAITFLPVKLISANVDNLKMQMQMQMAQQTEVKKDCVHAMTNNHSEAGNVSASLLCCDEQSDKCQTNSDCTHAANAMSAIFTSANVHHLAYTVSTPFLKPSVSLLSVLPSSIYRPPKI